MTERLHFHFSLSCIGEGNGNPLQCSCLENPRDSRAWWASVYGVAQSRTQLTRLSSSAGDAVLIPGSGRSPGGRHATHSSILARKILWTKKPSGLQSMGSQRVRHEWSDWARRSLIFLLLDWFLYVLCFCYCYKWYLKVFFISNYLFLTYRSTIDF